MTEAFIGQNVLITLKVPQGRTVEGVVSQVVPETATLILRNGTSPETTLDADH